MAIRYLIDSLKVEGSRIIVNAHPAFRSKFLSQDFYVEYDPYIPLKELGDEILAIPFLLNVLPVVWLSGDTYRIRTLDEELASSLERIRNTYRTRFPNRSWEGRLVPDATIACRPSPVSEGIALLFSGGVDSMYSSLKHRETSQVLITILSYLGEDRFQNDQDRAAAKDYFARLAAELGHRSSFVGSNLLEFISPTKLAAVWPRPWTWFVQVQLELGFASLTAPLTRHLCLPQVLIATGTMEYSGHPGSLDPNIANPIGWSGVELLLDGLEKPRQQKLRFVLPLLATRDRELPALRPCLYPVDGYKNCCKCSKCLRTIVGILAEGSDPQVYGFNTDPCVALSTLRKEFSSHRVRIGSIAILLQWLEIQMAIRTVVSSPGEGFLPTRGCADDLAWLSRFDLVQYFVRYQGRFRRAIREARSRLGLILDSWPPVGRAIRRLQRRLR